MRSNVFYKEFNDRIKDMNDVQLREIFKNVIRKLPETSYEEVLSIFDKNIDIVNEKDILNIINEYKAKFDLIDNFEWYFHASGYEEYGEYYSPWGGNWVWEYSDQDGIGSFINEVYEYAIYLTNLRKYKYAKELFDLILYANYQFLDDDGGDDYEISLFELEKEGLINLGVKKLCLYAIYVTFQCSDNKSKSIYKYFKNNNFKDISIEDSFNFGTEVLTNIDDFWNDWILLLLLNPGDIEYRLLYEAFEYNNYFNYQKYLDKISINHPKLYIDIFNFLLKQSKIDDIIDIGNTALSVLDKNLKIRNDIALYLAKYDLNNKEKYIIESFKSDTSVPNLLRIINNGYFLKHRDEIKKCIVVNCDKCNYKVSELFTNSVNEDLFYYLNFFTGNFDVFFDKCKSIKKSLGWSDSFIQYGIYLMLLYFDNNINSKVYKNILSELFNKFGFEDRLFLDDDNSIVFSKWKEQFDIIDNDKYIDWLMEIIDMRVDAIVGNNHRGSYFKAAKLVVALGEVLDSNGIQSKESFVDYYYRKYSRHSSFKKELSNYM